MRKLILAFLEPNKLVHEYGNLDNEMCNGLKDTAFTQLNQHPSTERCKLYQLYLPYQRPLQCHYFLSCRPSFPSISPTNHTTPTQACNTKLAPTPKSTPHNPIKPPQATSISILQRHHKQTRGAQTTHIHNTTRHHHNTSSTNSTNSPPHPRHPK